MNFEFLKNVLYRVVFTLVSERGVAIVIENKVRFLEKKRIGNGLPRLLEMVFQELIG